MEEWNAFAMKEKKQFVFLKFICGFFFIAALTQACGSPAPTSIDNSSLGDDLGSSSGRGSSANGGRGSGTGGSNGSGGSSGGSGSSALTTSSLGGSWVTNCYFASDNYGGHFEKQTVRFSNEQTNADGSSQANVSVVLQKSDRSDSNCVGGSYFQSTGSVTVSASSVANAANFDVFLNGSGQPTSSYDIVTLEGGQMFFGARNDASTNASSPQNRPTSINRNLAFVRQ